MPAIFTQKKREDPGPSSLGPNQAEKTNVCFLIIVEQSKAGTQLRLCHAQFESRRESIAINVGIIEEN